MSYKKTQKGNSISSGIKLMNRRDTLLKKSKILNKKKKKKQRERGGGQAIPELENSINKVKNALVSTKNRADNMREN